jgi:protein translocase SecG subunit
MSLLIGFLTFILVVNCLFLMLLVLVQLPKKEAGAGLAFGAGAVDTLIGAGSGNALTKMTKYAAGIFLALAVVLAILNSQRRPGASRSLQEELSRSSGAAPTLPVQQPTALPNTGPLTTPGTPTTTPSLPAAANQQTQGAAAPVINLTPSPQQPAVSTPSATFPAQSPAPAPNSTPTKQP